MKEQVLRDYFAGQATVQELAGDVRHAVLRATNAAGTEYTKVRITNMAEEFAVTAEHLLRVLAAVEEGDLDLEALGAISFCLVASDKFTWNADEPDSDGARVAEALFLLDAPEINYPLTPVVLAKISQYLLTGEHTLSNDDLRTPGPRPHLLSRTEKMFDPGV